MNRAELVKVGNVSLQAIREGGAGWLAVKAVASALRLDVLAQQRRIQRHPWAVTAMMAVTAADGKEYQTFCLRIDCVAMWLATIESSRIKDPAIRAELIELQKSAAAELDRWFRGAPVPAPHMSGGETDLDLLLEQSRHLTATIGLVKQTRAEMAQIAATQALQGAAIQEVKARQDKAFQVIEQDRPIAPELPGIATRYEVGRMVAAHAYASGRTQQQVWQFLYERLRAHFQIDAYRLHLRAGQRKVDALEERGHMDKVLWICQHYFTDKKQDAA